MSDIQSKITEADSFFEAGLFDEAERSYATVLAQDTRNPHALLRLGYLALLSNRLAEAQTRLTKAVELLPDAPQPKAYLAECYVRRDDFEHAAPLLQALGRDSVADKLELFKGQVPYTVESDSSVSTARFVVTDPLPVLQVRVNNSQPVNFLIDTGASDVILDTAFAGEVGVETVGALQGTFAGGKQAQVQLGRVDKLTIGSFDIRNVPVGILDTHRFSPIFGGMRIDGVIGTVLFYHFLITLDYPARQLVLRQKTEANQQAFAAYLRERTPVEVPFWMAGDHFIVARGTVNQSRPMLFFVDTGLAGGGFTCPESTIREAGIELDESKAREGMGGGGAVKIIPFRVERLSLGNAVQIRIPGSFSGGFQLEKAFGFHIGGIISHAFFRPYALSLDFSRMRLYLDKA
jgi:predicted aspartyl protease